MKKILLSAACGLLLANLAGAQTSRQGVLKYEGDANFAELALYYQQHPTKDARKLPPEEDEEMSERPATPDIDASRYVVFDASRTSGIPELPISPSPADTFQSTTTNGNYIPPDTHGAVGNGNYVVTADNYQVKIQNRTGGLVTAALTLDNWWGLSGTYDPRIHYDPYKNVWIMVTDYGGPSTPTNVVSKMYIAISATSDPTGTWHKYSITYDATLTHWIDFPSVGFNNKWVVISGNKFTMSTPYTGEGVVVFVIDYAALTSGSGGALTTASYTEIDQSGSFSICPALTYSATEPTMFLMETYHNYAGQLQEWEITGPVNAPVMSKIGWPTTSTKWSGSSYANNTTGTLPGSDFAPQVGTTHKLQTNDDRINNLVFRNGTLWTSQTVFLPYSATANPTRSSVMWWQTDTLYGMTLQNGLVDDATAATFYAFPSIAVNANNDFLIGFSQFSATTHPAAVYAYHFHGDPASSVRPTFAYRHGLNSYYQTFGGGKNRWGDYSVTCIDPSNDLDFWTNQESVTSTANMWDTWWAQIKAPTLSISDLRHIRDQISIVPNPSNGNFDIVFNQASNKPFHASISDMNGRIVYNREYAASQDVKFPVATSGIANGFYMLSIVIDGDLVNRKIEIVR